MTLNNVYLLMSTVLSDRHCFLDKTKKTYSTISLTNEPLSLRNLMKIMLLLTPVKPSIASST